MSERFGKLPFRELFEPAIRYAREGFVVSATVSELWKDAGVSTFAPFRGNPEFDEWFKVFTKDGCAPRAGEIWFLPDHADTLQEIAETGAESFYHGSLADRMDCSMREMGGWLRKEDLDQFEVEWVNPISVNYHGYEVCEIPQIGQGIIALMP